MRRAATVLACAGLLLAGAARAQDTTADTPGGAAPEAIEKLVLPAAPVACAFSAKSVSTAFTLELRPGVPYATINRVDAIDVKLPVATKPGPMVVRLTAEQVKLEGIADAASLPLFAARPFVAGDLFVPGRAVPITWTAAKAGQVDVSIAIGAEAKGAISGVDGPLRATRPCADLGVDHGGEFDRFRAVGARTAGATHVIAGEAPIPIAAKPGGRGTAQLVPPSGPALINNIVVVQKKKPWSRVGLDTGDFLIVGWVRDSDLKALPAASEIGEAYGVGGLGLVGSGESAGAPRGTFTCKQAAPLIAEVGVERLIVGSVGAGVAMNVDTTTGDLLPVRFVNFASFEAAAGAQFLVRRSDVERCPGFAPPTEKRRAK